MSNVIRTSKTYATADNAERALRKAVTVAGADLDQIRWLIAVAPDGRFAPVICMGDRPELMGFIHHGITVVN